MGQDRLNLAIRVCWLIVLAGVIVYFGYHLLARVAAFTTIVIGAIFFAYLIFPAVRRLNARMPLGLAIAVVYAAVLLVVGLGVYYVVPSISADLQQLIKNTPALVEQAREQLIILQFREKVPELIRDYAASLPSVVEANLTAYLTNGLTKVLPLLISFVAVGALFVVIPVVAAYMLFEAEDLRQSFLTFVPAKHQPKAQMVMRDLDHVVGGFLRGQLIVALIVGTLVTLLLLGLHVQYAVLIGVAAGILDVIPYVGAFAGWLPAFAIALLTNGFWNAVLVTVGIVAINQLEGHIIAPNVVSKSVNLTPLAVILALILGGELAGIPGLFLAVPVAGAIRVLIVSFRPTPIVVADGAPVVTKAPKPPLIPRLIALIRERTRKP